MTVNNNFQIIENKRLWPVFNIRSRNLNKPPELIYKKAQSEYSVPQTQNRNGDNSREKPDIFMQLLNYNRLHNFLNYSSQHVVAM